MPRGILCKRWPRRMALGMRVLQKTRGTGAGNSWLKGSYMRTSWGCLTSTALNKGDCTITHKKHVYTLNKYLSTLSTVTSLVTYFDFRNTLCNGNYWYPVSRIHSTLTVVIHPSTLPSLPSLCPPEQSLFSQFLSHPYVTHCPFGSNTGSIIAICLVQRLSTPCESSESETVSSMTNSLTSNRPFEMITHWSFSELWTPCSALPLPALHHWLPSEMNDTLSSLPSLPRGLPPLWPDQWDLTRYSLWLKHHSCVLVHNHHPAQMLIPGLLPFVHPGELLLQHWHHAWTLSHVKTSCFNLSLSSTCNDVNHLLNTFSFASAKFNMSLTALFYQVSEFEMVSLWD